MFWMASSWALCCRGQFNSVLVRWGRVANTMLWLLGKNIDGMKMELDIVFRCIQMNQKIYCIYMSRFVAQLYVHSEDVRIWGCSDTFKAAMLPGTQRSTGCLTRFGFGASIDLIHISSFKHPHTISTSHIQTQFSVSETIATARSTKSACHRLSRSISYDFHAEFHCVRAGACWVLQGHLVLDSEMANPEVIIWVTNSAELLFSMLVFIQGRGKSSRTKKNPWQMKFLQYYCSTMGIIIPTCKGTHVTGFLNMCPGMLQFSSLRAEVWKNPCECSMMHLPKHDVEALGLRAAGS